MGVRMRGTGGEKGCKIKMKIGGDDGKAGLAETLKAGMSRSWNRVLVNLCLSHLDNDT